MSLTPKLRSATKCSTDGDLTKKLALTTESNLLIRELQIICRNITYNDKSIRYLLNQFFVYINWIKHYLHKNTNNQQQITIDSHISTKTCKSATALLWTFFPRRWTTFHVGEQSDRSSVRSLSNNNDQSIRQDFIVLTLSVARSWQIHHYRLWNLSDSMH